jgi:AcrR family transcriptional regulator
VTGAADTPSASSPRKRDRAATRAALLKAARGRFARFGYDGTSVRHVAQDVSVDPALVFRYFGSKRGLFEEACVDHDRIVEIVRGPIEDLPADMLNSVVFQDWSQFAGEHPVVALLRSSEHDSARERLERQVPDDKVKGLAKFVEGPDAELRAELLVAFLLGMGITRSALHSPKLSEAQPADVLPYFEQVVDVLFGRTPADTRPAAADSRSRKPSSGDPTFP